MVTLTNSKTKKSIQSTFVVQKKKVVSKYSKESKLKEPRGKQRKKNWKNNSSRMKWKYKNLLIRLGLSCRMYIIKVKIIIMEQSQITGIKIV